MIKRLLQIIFATMFSNSYASELEEYIVAKNPKDVFDVEKLEAEFKRHRNF